VIFKDYKGDGYRDIRQLGSKREGGCALGCKAAGGWHESLGLGGKGARGPECETAY